MRAKEFIGPGWLVSAGVIFGLGFGLSLPPFLMKTWDAQWIGFAGAVVGGLLGGTLTVAAGYLAWSVAQRQLEAQQIAFRMSVLAQERALAHDELPGLFEIARLSSTIRWAAGIDKTGKACLAITAQTISGLQVVPRFRDVNVRHQVNVLAPTSPKLMREAFVAVLERMQHAARDRSDCIEYVGVPDDEAEAAIAKARCAAVAEAVTFAHNVDLSIRRRLEALQSAEQIIVDSVTRLLEEAHSATPSNLDASLPHTSQPGRD